MDTPDGGPQRRITRALLVFSALWSIGIGIWIAATPLYSSEIIAVPDINSGAEPLLSQHPTSFYRVQGVWGILVLVIFALLYSSGAIFYWRRRPGWSTTTGLLAIGLTYLAGFSIGPAYLPAMVATLAAMIWITARMIRRRRSS